MENLFFLAVPEVTSNNARSVFIQKRIGNWEADYRLNHDAVAVFHGKEKNMEPGVLFNCENPDEAFQLAHSQKKRLRFGSYNVLLDETSFPNVTFSLYFEDEMDCDIHLMEVACQWKKAAEKVFLKERIFVGATVYLKDNGYHVYVMGNANPNMVGNVDKWQECLKKVIARVEEKLYLSAHHKTLFVRSDVNKLEKQAF